MTVCLTERYAVCSSVCRVHHGRAIAADLRSACSVEPEASVPQPPRLMAFMTPEGVTADEKPPAVEREADDPASIDARLSRALQVLS
jgi:hypothetical protein